MDLLNLFVSILIAAVAFVVLDLRNEARFRRHALSLQGFEALRRQVVRHEGTLEAHARSLGLLAPPDARPTTPPPATQVRKKPRWGSIPGSTLLQTVRRCHEPR